MRGRVLHFLVIVRAEFVWRSWVGPRRLARPRRRRVVGPGGTTSRLGGSCGLPLDALRPSHRLVDLSLRRPLALVAAPVCLLLRTTEAVADRYLGRIFPPRIAGTVECGSGAGLCWKHAKRFGGKAVLQELRNGAQGHRQLLPELRVSPAIARRSPRRSAAPGPGAGEDTDRRGSGRPVPPPQAATNPPGSSSRELLGCTGIGCAAILALVLFAALVSAVGGDSEGEQAASSEDAEETTEEPVEEPTEEGEPVEEDFLPEDTRPTPRTPEERVRRNIEDSLDPPPAEEEYKSLEDSRSRAGPTVASTSTLPSREARVSASPSIGPRRASSSICNGPTKAPTRTTN